MFRPKPAEQFFAAARERQVGILARVPLASGMLTGKLTRNTQFDPNDHRSYNRPGEAFDQRETFSGVDYESGLHGRDAIRKLLPERSTLRQNALSLSLNIPGCSCTIPCATYAPH